ncbi:DUF84 family protein [Microbacterium sp. APC 3898]|uniref:inosine/xanthosine triphosphatase n=2 Tax=Planococcus TaxID=1372 RepID=A0ABT7ZIU9_9BACL|nr:MULTISPECIES: DUF84 family protein [Terrabacteria group]MBF6634587.1 DUF84 family protein [Planococcus sp. (in: firmicutes)]MBD8016516.1 DUF84 family protein [Planococcus wigleyi]MDN3427074.1 DUF84 family protein [Planococcus sp. APC 4016]MDN3439629.1 DUF84 family protein [Planococcus sp. APC 3900]MDN3499776.1 DUF84 family protein [Microbacterium sp. APC 3898]
MKKIRAVIASKNPAKINAVSSILANLEWTVDLSAVEAASGVSEQPFSQEETRQGAKNRAANALGDFDFAIGLEGGVYEMEGILYLCNWGALTTKDGRMYTAAGAQIPLPKAIADKLYSGAELGPVMDDYANEIGIRHHKGAIGILTDGAVNRGEMFSHVVKLLIGQYQLDSD